MHEELDTHHKALGSHRQSTPRAGEGLGCTALSLGAWGGIQRRISQPGIFNPKSSRTAQREQARLFLPSAARLPLPSAVRAVAFVSCLNSARRAPSRKSVCYDLKYFISIRFRGDRVLRCRVHALVGSLYFLNRYFLEERDQKQGGLKTSTARGELRFNTGSPIYDAKPRPSPQDIVLHRRLVEQRAYRKLFAEACVELVHQLGPGWSNGGGGIGWNRRLWRRLARAPEAVAGRSVGWPLPGSAELPRAAGRVPRRPRSRSRPPP